MKKTYLLLLLFTGFAFAQPAITIPTDYEACGMGFDLTTKTPEILGALDSSLYTVSYYSDAAHTLPFPGNGALTSSQQMVYVRVFENADPTNFSDTSFSLIPHLGPYTNAISDIIVSDAPFDGFAVFDLTTRESQMLYQQPVAGIIITYYLTSIDAANNVNPIVNPTAYVNQTPFQTIWTRLTSPYGCYTLDSIDLQVVNPNDIVFIPDPIFKNHLLTHNPTIDLNSDGEIEYTEAEAYSNILLIGGLNINDLTGIEAFINLTQLHCYNNNLTSLDLGGLTNLNTLYCSGNQLTSLNVDGDDNLTILDCDYNQLTSLDVSGLYNLYELFCNNNQLTSLQLSGTTNLGDLKCDNNQLTTLDVSNSVNLTSLGCSNNPITALDVSNLVNLHFLGCYDNLLTTLDVTNNASLITLVYNDNPNLTSVYMKNGADENINLTNNPNLQFICADESQLSNVQQLLAAAGMTNTAVNSYCSFTPGGNYNTITGAMTFDANNNGCGFEDAHQPNIRVNINNLTNQGASFTNSDGNYAFYTEAGSFDITPAVENQAWFNFSPTSASIPFADDNNNTAIQNFCITANGSHQDLEMVMAPLTPARPGFDAIYKLVYRNKGNTIMGPATAGIMLSYNINKMTYVSSTQPVTATGSSSINFNYPQLLPFASGSIEVTFHVNAPTDTPAVNIGDELQFMTMISPNNNDENIPDNTFNYTQTVVGSFDPNDITCLEGALVSPSQIGKYLHYVINFENTGTYQAENIVVKEIIDSSMYDLNSLQVLNSSAAVTTKIINNKAEFIFQNINLDSGGHGNILIKIKSKNTLLQGDSVTKKADIFFDYNFPITTNEANTTFQTLSNPNIPTDVSISIYPNPTRNSVNIKAANTISSVQFYDVQGRLLSTQLVNDINTTIDITSNSKGVYFVKVTTDKGIKVEKIVKE